MASMSQEVQSTVHAVSAAIHRSLFMYSHMSANSNARVQASYNSHHMHIISVGIRLFAWLELFRLLMLTDSWIQIEVRF